MSVSWIDDVPIPHWLWQPDEDACEVRAIFTTRVGGVSYGPFASCNLATHCGDVPANVEANRVRVVESLTSGVPVVSARQVHGTRSYEPVTSDVGAAWTELAIDADALVVRAPGVAAATLVADCVPVALATRGAVATVHAGWRGLADGVLERAVCKLARRGGDTRVRAAIGPAISGPCYAVGPDVAARFGDPTARQVDLSAVAAERLRAAGVEDIDVIDVCTHSDARLFSYRGDASVTGRQAVIAWRT